MNIIYIVTTCVAAFVNGYAAFLNFSGAESVKVVADRVHVPRGWMVSARCWPAVPLGFSLASRCRCWGWLLRSGGVRYPHVAELAMAVAHDPETVVGSGCDDQVEFEFALGLTLDGLERLRGTT